MQDLPRSSEIITPQEIDFLLDERYRLVEQLGIGPVHIVHRAYDLVEQKDVCIKLLKPHFQKNEGFILRYRRDLLELTLLTDPSWLTPVNLNREESGYSFQVLPLLRGLPFPQWFQKSQRESEDLVKVLTRCLLSLDRLSSVAGRTHGSIKPSNLYVTDKNEPLFADLAATGRLEDHFSEGSTHQGGLYFSPEQLSGERATLRTDLYGLGLVLYVALARRHPFIPTTEAMPFQARSEKLLSSLLKQLQSRPSSPSNFSDDVPLWADRFLARCLHPHPDERFQSHAEALNWLKIHTRRDERVTAERRAFPPAGRDKELAFFGRCLTAASEADGEGMILRLHGQIGCGKSRCLNWVLEKARIKQMRVVVVEPTPESGLHLQSVQLALLRTFPDLENESQPVVEGLLSLALDKPIVFVIKDIQEADDTLSEFLKELISVQSSIALVMILVDEETPFRSQSVRDVVMGLESSIGLGPLDRLAIANLIEEKSWTTPSIPVCTWIHQVSSGNALHASLLVEYILNQNLVTDTVELSWASSPPSQRPNLSEVLEWKLQSLSKLARNILETAAVLGQSFRLSTLNAITYRTEDEVDLSLSEGVTRKILELDIPTGVISYRWSHSKFRQTLIEGLRHRRKQRIHRLAAAFYSRGNPDPAKMAYHFLQANDHSELFYWGALALQQAHENKRRGEGSYWLNTLLNVIPEDKWLGPNITKAKIEVKKDQTESLDIDEWVRWLSALSGKETGQPDATKIKFQLQSILTSKLAWPEWSKISRELWNLLEDGKLRKRSLRDRARVILSQEWKSRAPNGEQIQCTSD